MADEHKPAPSSIWEPILFIGGIIGVLLAIAIYRGTIKDISAKGFLQSPLPPVGSGSSYTPSNLLPGMPGQPVPKPATTTSQHATTTNQ